MNYINYKGYKLSQLSLGTVQFGLDYGVANQSGQIGFDEAKEIIDFVTKKGINCFDTAREYGNSEKILGNILKDNKYIISKIKSKDFDNLDENIIKSLDSLSQKTLFGLLLHDSDKLFSWNKDNEKKINNLKQDKKIKFFGISIYTNDEFEEAIKNSSIDIIQIPFNLFDQRAIKYKWFEKAKENDKLLVIRSIFLQGLLLMDKNNIPLYLQEAKEYIVKLDDIIKQLKVSKESFLFSFVKYYAKSSIILFGCDNLSQAKKNIQEFNYNIEYNFENNDFNNISEKIYNPIKWKG